MTTPVFIINLDRDEQRLHDTISQLNNFPFLEVLRFPAFQGRTLPNRACHILTGNSWSHEHKGTLGCFLSHLAVWEVIANDTAYDYALVVEDNARFSNCEVLDGLELPEACDLVFCNSRTAYPDEHGSHGVPRFRPLDPVPAYIETHGRAVGTDGYLLTTSGARKLLEFVTKDRLFSHVDLRMAAYGLDPATAPATG